MTNARVHFLLLLLLGVPLTAQRALQPRSPAVNAQSDYTLQLNSNLVVLDIVVIDRKGNPVTDLKRDDFQIREDGVPQTALSFEAPGSNTPQAGGRIESTAELDKVAPQAPVNILVLDEINTRFEDMAFARYSLRKYLESQPGTLREPTMLAAATLRHFIVLQDYTQDKDAILQALKHHFAQYPWHLNGGSWKPQQFASAFAAVTQIAEATEGHPGHKNVIWVGRGFPAVRTDQMDPDEADSLTAAIQNCVNLLRDARVTLYTVDPAGLSTATSTDVEGFDDDDPFGGDIDFNALAGATGGKTFYGRNDVNAEIRTSIHDGSSFYTLSYRPTNASEQAAPFRKIRVMMKDAGLQAITRQGYYIAQTTEPGDEAAAAAAKKRVLFDLLAAADTSLVYDGVPVTVSEEAGSRWDIGIHVGRGALDWSVVQPAGEETATMQLVVDAFNRSNQLIERVARNLTIHDYDLRSSLNGRSRDAFVRVRLPHGLDPVRVRVVVRVPDSGKIGSANLDLTSK